MLIETDPSLVHTLLKKIQITLSLWITAGQVRYPVFLLPALAKDFFLSSLPSFQWESSFALKAIYHWKSKIYFYEAPQKTYFL